MTIPEFAFRLLLFAAVVVDAQKQATKCELTTKCKQCTPHVWLFVCACG